MRIGLLGGLRVEHDGAAVTVSGAMQLAVFFRLAVDAGRSVSYREIIEDAWGLDAPENERAALQSVISRLRGQLPEGLIESTPGGYRLAVAPEDVDALRFAAASAEAVRTGSPVAASAALACWSGEPWIPSENFDWFARDLRRDHAAVTALAAASASATAVPAPLSTIIGRESELAAIAAQLGRGRLVTVLGPGGAGKTRLAVEIARGRPDAAFVELAPVGTGEVLTAMLSSTGRVIRTEAASTEIVSARDRLLDMLRARPTLLVVDNCEHLVTEVAQVVADLLAAVPGLSVLTTSREPLGVPGEAFVPVGPLALPDDDDDPASSPAVELFRERAIAATGADFDELAIAARICRRLDGLPLAIELAAAKLRTMTAEEVLVGLEDRFALLTGGFRTALPRHQTLRAMIDWSWSLIGEDERRALSWLAVYPAGIAVADAGIVAGAAGLAEASVFDALVDRSLVQRVRGRYRALETIREYGIDRLSAAGELAAARESQARVVADRARQADALIRGPGIHDQIAWFDAEEDNIAAALRFATAAPLGQVALDILISSLWYWGIRQEEDAMVWFRTIAPLLEQIDSPEARLLEYLVPVLDMFDGGPNRTDEARETMRVWVETIPEYDGDHELLQLAPGLLRAFAPLAIEDDWMHRVRVPRGEDLDLSPWATALLHVIAGVMAQNRGEVEELGIESAIGVEQFEAVGDLWGLAIAQQFRAEWLTLQGRTEEALAVTDASTENMRRITPSFDLAEQQGLGIQLLIRLGRTEEAAERARAMVESAERGGNGRTILQSRLTAALVQVALKDAPLARELLLPIRDFIEDFDDGPGQVSAMIANADAGIAMLEGDLATAEERLRVAAAAAIASHDQPVMGMVAINVGTLALRRDDIAGALAAVEVATALIGAHDATHPQIAEIEAAARLRGIGRASVELTRPMAIEQLEKLA